jgi:hypothetical protein
MLNEVIMSTGRGIIGGVMQTAQELYSNEIRHLPLSERLRLTALLLDDLQTIRLPTPDVATAQRPRPKRGSGKADISHMAADFDAPLEEMREYSE